MSPTTPDKVLDLLQIAFGEADLGSTGLDCVGHKVEARKGEQRSEAGEAQVNLLYGELLPDGVTMAINALGILEGRGNILELGMGTGKVAFQTFFQTCALNVIGIEISSERYDVAVAAAQRVAAAYSDQYIGREAGQDELRTLLDPVTSGARQHDDCEALRGFLLEQVGEDRRTLWLLEGNLAIAGRSNGPCKDAIAVFLQLRLPPAARLLAYDLLQQVPDGCQVFSLENISWEWTHPEPSVIHPVDDAALRGETHNFATSWSPEGYPFYLFVADRKRSTTISAEYAVGYVQDLYSQAYF